MTHTNGFGEVLMMHALLPPFPTVSLKAMLLLLASTATRHHWQACAVRPQEGGGAPAPRRLRRGQRPHPGCTSSDLRSSFQRPSPRDTYHLHQRQHHHHSASPGSQSSSQSPLPLTCRGTSTLTSRSGGQDMKVTFSTPSESARMCTCRPCTANTPSERVHVGVCMQGTVGLSRVGTCG